MRVLLIYPEFPDTFWSFKHALKFVGKRATMPPTGLLTVSSMLPSSWERRLVDLNVRQLRSADMKWADYAMISSMNAQLSSTLDVLKRCMEEEVPVIAGGPLFSAEEEKWLGTVDHVVSGEAENVIRELVEDLESGNARFLYEGDSYPDLKDTPVPDWSLLKVRDYETVGIQFSRGCPHQCDFCNVTALFGHRVRTKSTAQILSELTSVYDRGWRSGVFFVDDNFIGNSKYLKTSLLPALIQWRRKRETVTFQTETSILISDDEDLLSLMASAGFNTVFIGIETPDDQSLQECGKLQNLGRDLLSDVRRIQKAGIQVQAGFIVGFDSDTESVFARQKEFIQRSGIVTAMVAMLQAPSGTRLFKRLKSAGRVTGMMNDGTDGTTNIIPVMGLDSLKKGYTWLVHSLYSPEEYYKRVRTFLEGYRLAARVRIRLSPGLLMAVARSVVKLGIKGRERVEYWKLLLWTAFRKPALLPVALRLFIYRYHCARTFGTL